MRRCWLVGLLAGCSPGDAAVGTTGASGPDGASTGASSATTMEAPTSGVTGLETGSGGSTAVAESTAGTTSAGTTVPETTTAEAPGLRIEPAGGAIEVRGGWSFPLQFAAVLDDGSNTPVPARWSVDEPGLARVTRYGGSLSARDTTAGVVTISAEFEGTVATAEVAVTIASERSSCPPRPPLTDGPPAPGAFVRVVAPEYVGTGVYHAVYLPPDWAPGRRYPVIVESPCNAYESFTGEVDDARLGYHLSGCERYVWIVLPYIQGQANLDYGWGELDVTLEYWRTNLRRTLEQVGGDPGAVLIGGFSRGAIGASWVGLQDGAIADAWLGFYLHSHADVVSPLTPDGGAGSMVRMGRVAGRASLLSWGAVDDGGEANSVKGAALLGSFGYPVTTLAVPGVGHTDAWILEDAASRATAQAWLHATVAARTGTGSVYGRVTDMRGEAVAGARVVSGLHFATSDAAGYYALRGLVPGMRVIECLAPACDGSRMVEVGIGDVEDVDFAG